jgi:LPS export ABC transporter protein LptC
MFNYLVKSIIVTFAIMMLFSCENDIEEVKKLTGTDTIAGVYAFDVEYFRTDSGKLQMKLSAPVMTRYEGNNPYTEFPKGFKIVMYENDTVKKAFIKANYGINYSKKGYLQARNDVVVRNYLTKEQMNTENLIWDQKKKKVYVRSFVKITTPDKIVFGDSLHANEDFSQRTIFNIHKSEIEVDEVD